VRLTPSRAGVALAIFALVAPARADPAGHPRVSLHIDPCVAVDPTEVRRIAAIELDAQLAEEAEPDTTRVRVTCDGPFVRVEAVDPITGKSLARAVHLETAMLSARPRLLAIAVAELVSASWTELAYNPRPQVPAASPAPSDEAKAAALHTVRERAPDSVPGASRGVASPPAAPSSSAIASHTTFVTSTGEGLPPPSATSLTYVAPPESPRSPDAVRAFRIEGLFEVRRLPVPGVTSLGVGVAVSRRVRGPIGVELDLLGDHGEATTLLGDVSLDTLSLGPSVFLETERGRFTLRGGAGLRVGLADLSGHASSSGDVVSRSFWSPWGGPFASASGYLAIVRGVALTLGAQLGDAPFPVTGRVIVGTAETDVSLVGAWFEARAGVSGSF
jgi:hypothetical protein